MFLFEFDFYKNALYKFMDDEYDDLILSVLIVW